MDDETILREIRDQHEILNRDVCRLRAAAKSRPQGMSDERWRALALGETRKLRESLRKHFALEEMGGYLQVVVEKHPGLVAAVRRLGEQHAEILNALDSVESACCRAAPPDEIESLALRGLTLLEKHQHAESDLIQEALGSDLGVAG